MCLRYKAISGGGFEPWEGMSMSYNQTLEDKLARYGGLFSKLGRGKVISPSLDALYGARVPCARWLSADPENGTQLGRQR